MGSREGHDQAERAITGPSRRFLVLFAETKSTSPAAQRGLVPRLPAGTISPPQTLRWFASGAPTIDTRSGE